MRAASITPADGGLALTIKCAVLEGAEEVIYTERRLRGIRSLETDARFWSLDAGDLVRDFVEKPAHPFDDGDAEYFTRSTWLERIDCYHVLPGAEPVLVGGLSKDWEDDLEVMRMVMERPWRMEIIRDPDVRSPRADRRATIQANDFRPATLMSFRIAYSA